MSTSSVIIAVSLAHSSSGGQPQSIINKQNANMSLNDLLM